MHPRRARTRMDSAKECLEEVGRGRDAGPPAGCGQAQPTLGTSESDRGVYLVILLVYLQQKKEEGLHQFSTPDVLSGGPPPPWGLGYAAYAVLAAARRPHDLGRQIFRDERPGETFRESLNLTNGNAIVIDIFYKTPHTETHIAIAKQLSPRLTLRRQAGAGGE